MSVINGMVRYIFHFIQQGSNYLDQVAIEKSLKKIVQQQQQQQQEEAAKKGQSVASFVKRFWGKHEGRKEPLAQEVIEDEEHIDWDRFASFEGSSPPPTTLYDKSYVHRYLMR